MRLAALLAAALVCSVPAAAADKWREYGYLENAFAIQFPAEPRITEGTYKTTIIAVSARIYSLEQDSRRYTVTVADFSKTNFSEPTIIELAIEQLKTDGDVKVDIPHRVNEHFGRQLSIAGKNGSRSLVALFYYQRRLYEIKGTILPTDEDVDSSDGARFQQSLRFTNNARPRDETLNRILLNHPPVPDFARER
jgi:hypothetical protein